MNKMIRPDLASGSYTYLDGGADQQIQQQHIEQFITMNTGVNAVKNGMFG